MTAAIKLKLKILSTISKFEQNSYRLSVRELGCYSQTDGQTRQTFNTPLLFRGLKMEKDYFASKCEIVFSVERYASPKTENRLKKQDL